MAKTVGFLSGEKKWAQAIKYDAEKARGRT